MTNLVPGTFFVIKVKKVKKGAWHFFFLLDKFGTGIFHVSVNFSGVVRKKIFIFNNPSFVSNKTNNQGRVVKI